MSLPASTPPGTGALPTMGRSSAPARRVRHQARDAVALMAFSAAASTAVAAALVILGHISASGR